MKAKSLDFWRNYFQGVNSTIFEIIDNAIIVAATDHPKEFKLQMGQIAEKLYWCHWNRCCGHDHNDNLNEECASGRTKSKLTGNAGGLKIGGGEQNTASSSRSVHAEMNMSQVMLSKYSYSEAETLTDEIDEDNEIFGEVVRIKEILDNCQDEVCQDP